MRVCIVCIWVLKNNESERLVGYMIVFVRRSCKGGVNGFLIDIVDVM